jgi:hypothetical protein
MQRCNGKNLSEETTSRSRLKRQDNINMDAKRRWLQNVTKY